MTETATQQQTTLTNSSVVSGAERHVELCRSMLKVFVTASRIVEFSEETWQVLMRLLVGIVESLLSSSARTASAAQTQQQLIQLQTLAEELKDDLLKTLFEIWLRSRLRCADLWQALRDRFTGSWLDHVEVALHWNALSLGLTRRLFLQTNTPPQVPHKSHLFAGSEESEIVYENSVIPANLHGDDLLHSWLRVIYLMNDPAALCPEVCAVAVEDISRPAEICLCFDVISTASGGKKPLNYQIYQSAVDSADSIIRLVGFWLCSVVWRHSQQPPASNAAYDEPCALAVRVLCRIFARPHLLNSPPSRSIVQHFLTALRSLLLRTPQQQQQQQHQSMATIAVLAYLPNVLQCPFPRGSGVMSQLRLLLRSHLAPVACQSLSVARSPKIRRLSLRALSCCLALVVTAG